MMNSGMLCNFAEEKIAIASSHRYNLVEFVKMFSYFFQINVASDPFLNVDCDHLRTFDQDLYRQLVCYPQVTIILLLEVLNCTLYKGYHVFLASRVYFIVLDDFLFFLQEVIPTFDMAVNQLFFDRYPDSILEHQIQVRPYNALKTRNMRSLNPEGKKALVQ